MLKQLLATAGVNVSLHIPDVPDISSVTDISTSSTSNMPPPPTLEEIPRNLLPKKNGKNKWVVYKKDFASLIENVMSNKKKGRSKLIQIFLFWFEEDLISMYNEYKIEARSVSDNKTITNSVRQNYHNLKKTVRAILLFCNKMPDMKPKNPLEILSWKNSLENMANDAISKLVSASIKNGLIKDEKDLTVTSLRNKEFGKNMLGHTLLLPKGYGRDLYP